MSTSDFQTSMAIWEIQLRINCKRDLLPWAIRNRCDVSSSWHRQVIIAISPATNGTFVSSSTMKVRKSKCRGFLGPRRWRTAFATVGGWRAGTESNAQSHPTVATGCGTLYHWAWPWTPRAINCTGHTDITFDLQGIIGDLTITWMMIFIKSHLKVGLLATCIFFEQIASVGFPCFFLLPLNQAQYFKIIQVIHKWRQGKQVAWFCAHHATMIGLCFCLTAGHNAQLLPVLESSNLLSINSFRHSYGMTKMRWEIETVLNQCWLGERVVASLQINHSSCQLEFF